MSLTVANFLSRKDFISVNVDSVSLPLPNTLMGIEVEVDQDSSTDILFPENYEPEWSKKHDGSLRNGYEYVLSAPMMGQHLVNTIYKLYAEPARLQRTYTGSTHIHINMMDGVSVEALRTLVLLSYAFESLLYYVGDNTRQWCGFANRLISAPSDVLETIIKGNSGTAFRRATDRAGRYYGLNLDALNKYGTVEFRYFPTAESAEELLSWVKLVQLFKKAAMEVGTINNLIDKLSDKESYNTFVTTYFSDYSDAVAASADYRKVKSLMAKAMVIASAARTPKLEWDVTRLRHKFGKLLGGDSVVDVTVPPVHVVVTDGAVPSASTLVRTGVAELGPSAKTFLIYRGGIYLAYSDSGYTPEWIHLTDIVYRNQAIAYEVQNCANALKEKMRQVYASVYPTDGSVSFVDGEFRTLRNALARRRVAAAGVVTIASSIDEDHEDDYDDFVESPEYHEDTELDDPFEDEEVE